VQRSAGELRTLALGAKQGSSPASAIASTSPLASSGRDSSSSGQFSFCPAEACLSRISGAVARGRNPAITVASRG
jgi:hypothetical protein